MDCRLSNPSIQPCSIAMLSFLFLLVQAPIREIGMESPELLSLVENCPKGRSSKPNNESKKYFTHFMP